MKKIQIPDDVGQALVEAYSRLKSTYQLQNDFGFSRSTIYRYLKEKGVVVDGYSGPRRTQAILNESFFNSIDSEKKAYWLGFMAADGCVRKTKHGQYHTTLLLAEKDKDHLEKFRTDIGSSHKLQIRNGRVSVCISRKRFYDDLSKNGVVPNKTFKLEYPIWLPMKLRRHWVRGYFDGDGCWYTRRKSLIWSVVSVSPACLQLLQKDLVDNCNLHSKKLYQRGHVFRLVYEGRGVCGKLYEFMYHESSVCLERKRQIAKEFLFQ